MGTNNGNGYAHKHLRFSAISEETAKHLLEELMVLEPADLTQIAYMINTYTTPELKELKARLMHIKDQVQEVIYKRSPKGKKSSIATYAREKERRARVREAKLLEAITKVSK